MHPKVRIFIQHQVILFDLDGFGSWMHWSFFLIFFYFLFINYVCDLIVIDISKDSHLECKSKYEVFKSQSEDFVTLQVITC